MRPDPAALLLPSPATAPATGLTVRRRFPWEAGARSYSRSIRRVWQAAEGAHLIDECGDRYLDMLSGAGALPLGHRHPAIESAVAAHHQVPATYLDMRTGLEESFVRALQQILPMADPDLCVQFCGPSGSDSVEVAIKLARVVTGRPGIVGANVGKNKETEDAAADYAIGIRATAPHADYLVVNVSSPNTPGLRTLQSREALAALLARCVEARAEAVAEGAARPPLLLKVAPDLTDADKADIAAVVMESGIDGLIVSNTTVARPAEIPPALAAEAGGLSGRPLMAPSTRVLGEFYRLTGGKLPLVGVGGVASGADAYAKIRAGAAVVQLYSALAFQGPGLVRRIKRELAALLARDGFASVAEAVGADHR